MGKKVNQPGQGGRSGLLQMLTFLLLLGHVAVVQGQNTYRIVSSLEELNEADTYALFALAKPRTAMRLVMGNVADAEYADQMEAVGLYVEDVADFDEQGLLHVSHDADVAKTADLRLESLGGDVYALRMTNGSRQGYLRNASGNKLEVVTEDASASEACQWTAKHGKNAGVVYFRNARTDGKYIMTQTGSRFYCYDITGWDYSHYLAVLCKLVVPQPAPTGIDAHQAAHNPGSQLWHNLQGQAVSRPGHGIYIRNGKKRVF